MTVPTGVTLAEYEKALAALEPQLLATKPSARYHDGQRFDFEDFSVVIRHGSLANPQGGSYSLEDGVAVISIGAELRFDEPSVERYISDGILRMARIRADALIDRAKAEAARVGAMPRSWEIVHGKRKLGHCTATRHIALSEAVMLLPVPLQRAVISHELAHLTHLDHSPAFHALCNQYLGGYEAQLFAALRAFNWPIIS